MRVRAITTTGFLLAAIVALGASPATATITPTQITNDSVSGSPVVISGPVVSSLIAAEGSISAFATATNVYVRDRVNGGTQLASRDAAVYNAGSNGNSALRAMDAEGLYTAFTSNATNLISGFTNPGPGTTHLYVYDRVAAQLQLVDHAAGSATTAGNGDTGAVFVSNDGSTVVFASDSTDLVVGGTVTGTQVYAFDIASGVTRLVSHVPGNSLAGGNASADVIGVSGDGGVITLRSDADDLVAGFATSAFSQLFAEVNGSIALASRANGSSTTGGNGPTSSAEISSDGSVIALNTEATDLVTGVVDANGASDVVGYEVADGTTTLLSHTAASPTTTASGPSIATGISATGVRVLITSSSNNLVADFIDNSASQANAYLADVATTLVELVSAGSGPGNQGANGATNGAAISADGRIAVLTTDANNLGWSSNGFAQVAAANLDTGELALVSRTANGNGANAASSVNTGASIVSTTGGFVTFTTASSDLAANVPGDGSITQAFTATLPIRTGAGYWLFARDGGVFSFGFGFGQAHFYGSTGGLTLNQPIVDGTSTPSGQGYWLAASDGGIFSFGDAQFSGSTGALTLAQPIVDMLPVPWTTDSYWLVARDGGVFSFGPSAEFHGSTGALTLNQPVVGGAATPRGNGYWFVAADGGIFSFGDAAFYGSTGALTLNQPIVGMAPTPSGRGYWLVARDGGIFSFGDAEFFGSTGALTLNEPIVGMASSPTGLGYWFTASDGGIFTFGDARFYGSMAYSKLNQPIVGMAVS